MQKKGPASSFFPKSLCLVGVGSLAVLFLWVALLAGLRHATGTQNPLCPGILPSSISSHNSILESYPNILKEWEGQWHVQATTNWFMNGFIDFKGTIVDNAIEWCWFNSFFLLPAQTVSKVRQSREAHGLLQAESESKGFGGKFFPQSGTFILLDYEPGNHLILYGCGTTWVPEGSLLVMTRDNVSEATVEKAHDVARELAAKHHVDTLFYTVVPHTSSTNFFYKVANNTWRTFLCLLFIYVAVCHLLPFHVTVLNSFSYTTLVSWGFGQEKFGLQTALMYTYHQSYFAIISHSTILIDLILWYTVIATFCTSYFGSFVSSCILAGILAIQLVQLLSYRDLRLAALSFMAYIAFAMIAVFVLSPKYDSWCRLFIFATALFRVAGHTPEPFPPILSGSDAFISLEKLLLVNKLKIPFAILIGIVSECAVGMPTRGFPFVFYITLTQFGYTSKSLISMQKCDDINKAVKKNGWAGHLPFHKAVFG